jgi:undecaprenyl-diphosphatase
MVGLDEELFLWINQTASGPTATAFMRVVTYLGHGLVLAVLILPTMYIRDRDTFRRHAIAMVVAVALSGLVVNGLKIVVDRPRPPEHLSAVGVEVHAPIGVPPDRSFPSGHAQTAFGAAVYLSCLYPPAAPAFLLAAALVALSRIALGVHFPSDVVVGGAFGAVFSGAAFLWVRRRRSKQTKTLKN